MVAPCTQGLLSASELIPKYAPLGAVKVQAILCHSGVLTLLDCPKRYYRMPTTAVHAVLLGMQMSP